LATNSTSSATLLRNLWLLALLSQKMMLKECRCLRFQSAVDSKASLTLCLITAMILCTLCKMLWTKRNSCSYLPFSLRTLMIMLSNLKIQRDKTCSIFFHKMPEDVLLSIFKEYMMLFRREVLTAKLRITLEELPFTIL
jgi:hypothetical protein